MFTTHAQKVSMDVTRSVSRTITPTHGNCTFQKEQGKHCCTRLNELYSRWIQGLQRNAQNLCIHWHVWTCQELVLLLSINETGDHIPRSFSTFTDWIIVASFEDIKAMPGPRWQITRLMIHNLYYFLDVFCPSRELNIWRTGLIWWQGAKKIWCVLLCEERMHI